VLDLLASLVDQSLVIAEDAEAGVRYRLLETVRQYGLERLAEAGEDETARARHRDHFLALAEEAGPHLETGRQPEFLELLDPEAANLAAAIDYTLHTNPPHALRFCAALYRWWRARGRLAEAELAHGRSLDACGEREPRLRAHVRHGCAFLAILGGEFEAAQSHAAEALALAEQVGDRGTAARARCGLGIAMQYADPRAGRAELGRAAELARAAGDDWTVVQAKQVIALAYLFQNEHTQCADANDEVASLVERLGDPLLLGRRWLLSGVMAYNDGRFGEARDAAKRIRAAAKGVEEELGDAYADMTLGFVEAWQGEQERALERAQGRLDRALTLGAGMVVPMLLSALAFAELAGGRLEEARDRLEGLVALVEGRHGFTTSWALGYLAEARRLLADDGAEATALEAQAWGERIDNRLLATRPRLTLGRLAAVRGSWRGARQHALAHLDACVEGGHATYVPACLDALAEVSAGIEAHEDAVRLFAAAERARSEIGIVRVPPEAEHWAAVDQRLRKALGDQAYEAARAQGAELSTGDAVEWARRARGARRRPPGGWDSLTPTELKVVELVAQGLTNPQVAERMFVSPSTVKTHLAHVFSKLDVHNRAELGARAGERNPTG
jgi:DNA-binding CsgD family transcriptional regulator